jgi:predicted O-methyltransferase YrrM
MEYKVELDKLYKITQSDYLYNSFLDYGFKIDDKFINFDSNINIYEAGFISLLIQIYIKKYKTTEKVNVLEIGLAYGTSSIIILNELEKYGHSTSYDVIDPYQERDWKNMGLKNIKDYLQYMDKQNIIFSFYKEDSRIIIPKFHKKYDVVFIDGSHDELIVIQDFVNSDYKLKENGLIIIDDVKHTGVKKAIITFFINKKNYQKIHVSNKGDRFIIDKIIYETDSIKKSFENPNTMFCFQKISGSV